MIKLCVLLLLSASIFSDGRLFSSSLAKLAQTISKFRVNAATLDRTLSNDIKSFSKMDLESKPSLDVRIDDVWYDLTNWRRAHPSGEHWIDLYRGRDATEVMHAFHSSRGKSMYSRLPKSENHAELEESCVPVSQLTRNFRSLRQKLEAEGWWERDLVDEGKKLLIWAALAVGGIAVSHSIPFLAVVLLALAQTTAGWLAHDYAHGVDKFSFSMKNFGCISAGLSPTWWSDKHNKHHALTNEIGVDEDIATDPFLYVYPPHPKRDSPLRKVQGILFPIPLSLLFFVWNFDSLKLCVSDAMNGFKRKTKQELLLIVAHWAYTGLLVPLPVIVGYTFLAGFLTAVITTTTHQSEELFTEHNPDFVNAQFRSTRDAKCESAFTEWLWGGMQYQLEHHLFPSMPRSKYPAMAKVLKSFALENNIEYRVTNEWKLIGKNFDTYRKIASVPASESSRHYEGKQVSWGGRGEVVAY